MKEPDPPPIAHSAPRPGAAPQPYPDHINGARATARERLAAMLFHFKGTASDGALITAAVIDGVTFHDLGKLDPETQRQLWEGRNARLTWDHVDAGVAHLGRCGAWAAAWLVRSHHAPGLPSGPHHFTQDTDRKLRGRRRDSAALAVHHEQIARTDRHLPGILAAHEAALGRHAPTPTKAFHGLRLRFALSAMVDADHADSSRYDRGWEPPLPPSPRWKERLAALDAYVAGLDGGDPGRNALRRAVYQACHDRAPDAAMIACEGPVGIGKTTAVTAYLLRRAIATEARRLIIVAPFTTILSQTARRLREALVLEKESPDAVVAEHHHRADFDDISSRDLATLWAAPVILTTSVQFFETLSSNVPSALRKLNALPGSVIFMDEAHAALPVSGTRTLASSGERVETAILPQYWRWMRELARDWTCSFVYASGSLARFWEHDGIVGDASARLPDLVPAELVAPLRAAETARVRYQSLGHLDGPAALAAAVAAAPGPRLLVMNTVQSAAVMAQHMREAGHDVLHLSTALSPSDRALILKEVEARLHPARRHDADWTLVATSLMEAGVDVSFRSAFRERFSTASLIQISGRANRNGEWPGGAVVYDFTVELVEGLTGHPDARVSAEVLARLFAADAFGDEIDPAALVTRAMRSELRRGRTRMPDLLAEAEAERRYPDVASLGRVIDADTRLVVVDPGLRDRLAAGETVPPRDLLAGSVQIWAARIAAYGLEPIAGRDGVYWWRHEYDPGFLGYMEGALQLPQAGGAL